MLLRVLNKVTRLGSSRSLVAASLAEIPPEATHVPYSDGKHLLRVVGPGRLKELDDLYAIGLRPTPGVIQRYSHLAEDEARGTTEPESSYELFVLRFTGKHQFQVGQSLLLTETLRAAVLAHAGDSASALIHGHGNHPHCAWLALPFVGHPHADGRLLGLGIVVPRDAPTLDRRQLLRAIGHIKKLQLGGRGEVHIEPGIDDIRVNLKAETWCRPAKRWASVTPVVLDRFPHERRPGQGTADILLESIQQLGLPVPEKLAFGNYSPIAGVPPAKANSAKIILLKFYAISTQRPCSRAEHNKASIAIAVCKATFTSQLDCSRLPRASPTASSTIKSIASNARDSWLSGMPGIV